MREQFKQVYWSLLKFWGKGAFVSILAGVLIFAGSFVLSPQWSIEKRFWASLIFPAMSQIGITGFCLFFGFKMFVAIRKVGQSK
jgi:hypothetical protein